MKKTDTILNEAIKLHQSGKVAEAIALYSKILPNKPNDPQLLYLFGTAKIQINDLPEGVELLKRSILLNDNNEHAHFNFGNALHKMGDLAQAKIEYNKAIKLNPSFSMAHNNLGNINRVNGDLIASLKNYEDAIKSNPQYADAHNNKGIVLQELNKDQEALSCYNEALKINPNHAEAHNNLGFLWKKHKKVELALKHLKKSIELKTDFPDAYNNLGIVLNEIGELDHALTAYDNALKFDPTLAVVYNNKGVTLKACFKHHEALSHFKKATSLKIDYYEAYNNIGVTLIELLEIDLAIKYLNVALQINPNYIEANWNKSLAFLTIGNYNEGWDLYEIRKKKEDLKHNFYNHQITEWSELIDIKGKTLLIYSEQGYGDTIQFCRYLNQAIGLGAKVIFAVQPALVTLISISLPGITVLSKEGVIPHFDFHCPLLSLPRFFKNIPFSTPYLFTNSTNLNYFKERLGPKNKMRVGISWSGSKEHKNDINRSIPIRFLKNILNLPIEFHSLQIDHKIDDHQILTQFNVKLHKDKIHNFLDTASLIECMDLVISVDTSVAHLAGALDKPLWILLPYSPDFRWQLDSKNTPWYPRAKLFRQLEINNWQSVIDLVTSQLTSKLQE